MLLLKRHLVQLVREGKKRQTIRLWSRPIVHAGQISYTPGLGRMLIISVERVESLAALTEEDALADGFVNRAALLAEIEKIYGIQAKPPGPAKSGAKKSPRTSAAGSPPPPPPAAARFLYRIRFQWPIDAAGEALVIRPTPVGILRTSAIRTKAPAKSRTIHVAPPPRPPVTKATRENSRVPARQSSMSAKQRHALRAFVMARAPASVAHPRRDSITARANSGGTN